MLSCSPIQSFCRLQPFPSQSRRGGVVKEVRPLLWIASLSLCLRAMNLYPRIKEKGWACRRSWVDGLAVQVGPGALVYSCLRCGRDLGWLPLTSNPCVKILELSFWGSNEGRKQSFLFVAQRVGRMHGWVSIFNGSQYLLIGCNLFVLSFPEAT